MELLKDIPIDSLKLAAWDVRRKPYPQDQFGALKLSIETNGLIYPLSAARMKNGDLLVMAGRHRLKAIKELGWKTVPLLVTYENVEEEKIRNITIQENKSRHGIDDVETGYGILARFEPAGYNKQQTIEGVKAIDNWFAHNTSHKVDWNQLNNWVVQLDKHRGDPTNPLVKDEIFRNLCKSMGISPKYQYQCLQIVTQLEPEILQEAIKAGLNSKKKLLLTHTKIRSHPKLQKQLIRKIKDESADNASVIVRQTINDLETGYIEKEGTSYVYSGKPRDKIEKEPKTEINEKNHESYYLKVMATTHKYLFQMIGKPLAKGEHTYKKESVETSSEHRYKIVKSLTGDVRALTSLHDILELARLVTKNMLEIIDAELDVAVQKNEMNRR